VRISVGRPRIPDPSWGGPLARVCSGGPESTRGGLPGGAFLAHRPRKGQTAGQRPAGASLNDEICHAALGTTVGGAVLSDLLTRVAAVAPLALSADEARRAALRAQGFLGAAGSGYRRGGVRSLVSRLGAIQLDTISVLARSHELVAYARLGPVGRAAVEDAYWNRGASFEYWAHAACILAVQEWPVYAFRRRAWRARGWSLDPTRASTRAEILARLAAEGPLTATELGGAKRGGPWWDWSEVKIAVEQLLDVGDVVVTRRRGWRRVYDLPERALPAAVLTEDLDDETCLTRLVEDSGRCLGVADVADLADYHRLRRADVRRVVGGTSLVPVNVAGWSGPAWASPDALAAASRPGDGSPRGHHRTTLLSPFDSLVWDRARTERIFGFTHRLEAYVPKPKRVHGYFAMPLLAGGRLQGRVDPRRDGKTLVAAQVSLERGGAVAPMAQALADAANWVGCDAVAVEQVLPETYAAQLRTALR
jgi:uncharacterized protein YcaQ